MSARCPPSVGFPSSPLPPKSRTVSPLPPPRPVPQPHTTHPVAFGLFILLNAVLFIRPGEIFADLEGYQLYEPVILACLAASFPEVVRLLSPASLARQPITVCVVGLLPAILLSHLSHANLWGARMDGFEFFKLVVYYVLLLANVSTPARLRQFFVWLVLLVSAMTTLSVLQHHHIVEIPSLTEIEERTYLDTGEVITSPRLVGSGVFHDPNDLCLILLTATWVCLYGFTSRFAGSGLRILWLLPVGLFGYALLLTQSRGGFLAVLGGALALIVSRYGWRKSLLPAAVILPLLWLLFSGRATEINVGNYNDTSQQRIHFWSAALVIMRQAPVFGIGMNELEGQIGAVAHNGFVQCYVELGLVGGTLFFGCFAAAGWSLIRLSRDCGLQNAECGMKKRNPNSALRTPQSALRIPNSALSFATFNPFALAIVASYATGMMSLSRSYTLTTYVVLGLAATYIQIRQFGLPRPVLAFDLRFLGWLVAGSLVFLVGIYLFVRFFAQWS
jgi:putative inorganic carbon (hco3(-)) transporter